MKILGIVVAVLVLLVVAVFVYVGSNTNGIVERAIETLGPQYLGAPVSVGTVNISLRDGHGTLTDLEVGNPPGYTGPYAMRIGKVDFSFDVANSTSKLIVMKQLTIDGADVAAVANTPKETNLRTLSRNVPKSSSDPLKLIIDRLDVTNTHATVTSPWLTQRLETTVPDIHLTEVGRSTNGAQVGQVVEQILKPIIASVSRSLGEAGVKGLGVDPDRLESDAAKGVLDAIQGMTH